MNVRVLVVEDDPLIAFGVAEILRAANFDVVGPAGSVVAALKLIDDVGCDVALLDISLGRESAAPVAVDLRSRSLPFVALSGHSASQMIAALRDCPGGRAGATA